GQTVADTFNYTISDGHGGTSSTTLTITVTGTADVVGANPDVNTVTEDTTLTASGNVITTPPGADTDTDPTAVLTVTAVSGTGTGTDGGNLWQPDAQQRRLLYLQPEQRDERHRQLGAEPRRRGDGRRYVPLHDLGR